ncbi:non-hydrolyzing UDP-N-acetylglucosamine 2-epimerase [Nitrospira sp. Nam74]
MKIMLIAGARPNFMKIASIVEAIQDVQRAGKHKLDMVLVHTGQHYDEKMSKTFFKDLSIPEPNINLEVGSSSHAVQTAEVMKRFEPVLLQERPDAVLVVGDVNSTIACSLVASKVAYPTDSNYSSLARPLIVHVEVGLRSDDWTMPEEINRVLTDRLSDLLFVTEPSGMKHLRAEGIPKTRIHYVGNTMVDTLLRHRQHALESTIFKRLGHDHATGADLLHAVGKRRSQGHVVDAAVLPYALVTLHRPSNVDDPETFKGILDALIQVSRHVPVIFPVHPRTVGRVKEHGLGDYCRTLEGSEPVTNDKGILHCIEPLGYLDFLCLMSHARVLLTDSGGIQEETTALGVPCVTLRKNTERPVTITHGTNRLAGTNPRSILREARASLTVKRKRSRTPPLWDGNAAQRIVSILIKRLQANKKLASRQPSSRVR